MNLIPQRFRARLALLFGGLALIIGLPMVLSITRVYEDQLIADRGETLHDLASAAATLVGENLRERLREITHLARSPLFQHADLDSPALRASLEEVQSAYRLYSWIGLADPAGQVRAATGGLLVGVDVSQRPWFQLGLKGPYIGDLHEALLLSRLLPQNAVATSIRFIDFTTPVRDAQGALRGVLGVHAHWDWARAVIQVLTPHQTSGVEIFLVNRNGQVLYPEAAGSPAKLPPGLTADSHYVVTPWDGAQLYLSVLAPVPEVLPDQPLGWRISVRQPQALALAQIGALRTRMVILALAAVLLFAALAWWSAWRFAQPLGQLVAVARRIEAGEEDLVPALQTGSVEFHDLAKALRTLAATLIRRREALSASEERFRYAMDASTDGIWDWNLQTGYVYYSPGYARMMGYEPGTLAQDVSTWIGLLHPEERERVVATAQRLLKDPGQYELEFRLRTAKDGYRWVLSRGKVVERDAGEAVLRAVGTHVDITERKRLELELRRFRQIVEVSSERLAFADRNLRFMVANPAYAAMYASTPEQLCGRALAEFLPPAILAEVKPHLEAALSGEPQHFQIQSAFPDGRTTYVEIEQQPFWQDGEVQGVVASIHDLTEIRAAQADLEAERTHLEERVVERTAELLAAQAQLQEALERVGRSEARFRTMFEEAPLGIALTDSRTGQIFEVNPRLAAIAGRSREELISIDWMRITHPDDVQVDLDHMARLNAGEISGFSLNKRYLRPDGSPVWIAMTIAKFSMERVEGPCHLCMIKDITAQREQEEALRTAKQAAEAANLAKSEFLAHMSHEIRTPMNAVLGLAQVLERTALDDRQRPMVQQVRAAGESLLAILNDILDLSKIEAGQLSLERRLFALAPLLTHVRSLLGDGARSKGLELVVAAPPPLAGGLIGDPLRLEQILVNLIGNAIKFTDRGEVQVAITPLEATPERVRLRFAIRDTGIGISPEVQMTLFTPFIQADAGISRRFGGTGLGLAISKRLVELMGGEIGVDSQPGQGSTFWFELPFSSASEAEEARPAAPVPAAPTGPRLRGLHLLVVDDSAINRELVEQALALEGAAVTQAADGQQAVQYLRTPAPGFDAVLMDVRMPIMDGLTAMRLIRQELGLSDLPILALTAGVLPAEQQAARDAGANEVLAKPLNLDLLARRLAHHVGAERLAAAAEANPADEGATSARPGTWPPPPPLVMEGKEVPVSGDASGPTDFPAITGIDGHSAALTLGPNRAFFLRMLGKFLDGSPALLAQARQALTQGDRETAARLLNGLTGNAGIIGAMAMMAQAGRLEQAIAEGETAIAAEGGEIPLEAGLAELAGQVAALATASAPWLTPAEVTPAPDKAAEAPLADLP